MDTARAVPPEIQLSGDIDLSNAAPIGEALCKALSRRQLPLVVHLGEVTFIDSSAIAMMLLVHRHADALGVTVTWSNPRPQACRVMRITGVDQFLLVQAGGSRLPDPTSA
jgi:anti-anti-sigma factor